MILFVGAIASAVEMAILYDPNNINRVYYGTDTRFFALLLGASLAFIWPIHKLSENASKGSRLTFDGVGLLLMLGMIYYYITMSGSDAWAYHGGMFIFSLLATLFVAIIVHPASHWNQWLTNPVFTYIGKRSYGIYVYQFPPVMIFYENSVKSIGNHPVINALIQVAIILLISELSYRYIETPLKHFDWHQLGASLKNPTRAVTAAIMAVMVVLTFVGMATKPEQSTADSLKKTITARQAAADKKNQKAELLQKKQAAQAKKFAHNRKLEKQAIKHLSAKKRKVMKEYGITAQEMVTLQHTPLTSVGDSVMIDISGGLQQLFPGAVVDGQVGRQMDAAQSIVQQMASSGKISNNLLLNLGTNGTVTSDQVEAVMDAVGKKCDVYWTTAYVPNRSWQNEVNSTIIAASKKHKNLHIIDWYSLAKKHPGWFTSDGIHPNNTGGVRYFARLVAKSIAKDKQ
nr:acyltransferase family protein [Lentilactobacillus senioris]